MSTLQVTVTVIEAIRPHPNADALEIAEVLGWQLVVKKGAHKAGEKVVYFPPDTILPVEVSDRFGVTKYLSKQRIRCARLRGEPSFGLAVAPDDVNWELGINVAAHYGATKYEPPVRARAGDAAPDHPLFVGYTEIENMRNFPDVLAAGEEVVYTEKIHGTCCRVGVVEGEWMAGSKGLRRQRPEGDAFATNLYWYPWGVGGVRGMLEALAAEHRQVILFGEVYGRGVQTMTYGLTGGIGFRAFDLLVDGKYVDHDDFAARCEAHGVERVPLVAREPFALERARALSEGRTLLVGEGGHIREGVVAKPVRERTDPRVGRVILKYVSDTYLFGDASDYKDV